MRAKLVDVMGDTPAATLLSVLPQPVDGGFASNGRLELLETRVRGNIDLVETRLRGDIELVETRLRGEIAELRSEMHTEFAVVRTEFAVVRAEIETSAADTLKSMRAMFLQLIGVMCTLGGLAIALAKLL